jgi:Right handed beta helix region/Prenyltransferase and squalene oxidase repeat
MTGFRRVDVCVRVKGLAIALGMLAGVCCGNDQAVASATFQVHPKGRDTWSGTLAAPNAAGTDGPFATISRARDAVRRFRESTRPREPVVVRLHAGRYELTEPVIFKPEDSGTAESPTIYAAAPGDAGKVVISGGRVVASWKSARGARGEWVADLPGLKDGPRFRQVSIDGQWRDRTRLPVGETTTYTMAGLAGANANAPYDTPADRFEYAPGQVDPGWTRLRDVEVVVLHFWIDSHLKIAGVEPDRRVVKLDRRSHYKFTDEHHPVPGRYYVTNVYEALSPGCFYTNSASNTLHYMPRDGELPDRVRVVAPRLASLVELRGDPGSGQFVENITFQGLILSDTCWEPGARDAMDGQAASHVPGAVIATGARHVAIKRCVLKNLGGYGIDLRDGCRGVRIAGNELAWIGAGGIKVTGAVDPEPRRTGETIIEDNRLHHLGRHFHSGVGVLIMNAFGNSLTHNEISDLYYTGVSVGWVWGYGPSISRDNRIEFNHIHHVGGGLLSDLGGVYSLGVSPGTVVRNNIVHHVEGHDKGWGLYTDEGSTGILLENNLVYRTTHGSFHQHYGRDNIVRNNIFALGRDAQIVRSRDEPHRSFTFERNIVYYRSGELFNSVWSGGTGHIALDHNLYWNASGSPPEFPGGGFEAWQAQGFDKHSRAADPRFVDAEHDDFHLKPDSPARSLGFRPIDFSSVGPRKLAQSAAAGKNESRYSEFKARAWGGFNMRWVLAVLAIMLSEAAWAQEPRDKPRDVSAAIDRGLAFLAKDAVAWKSEHKCVSCHHAGLVIWSMHEAKQRGHKVNETVLAELTQWIATSGDGKFGQSRPPSAPKALNPKAVWFALALGADPQPDDVSRKGMKLLVQTVKSDQTENGSWSAWPETRPPIFGDSDECMTALATLAVVPAAAAGDDSARSVRDKGIRWLAETKSDGDPQSIAMRLVLWRRLGRPAKEWQPLVERIKARQNDDGGWSQTKAMASDAWATGQALYALGNAGIKPDEPVIANARAFLIKTQREDGSWPMTSRPVKPGGDGSKSLIPITGAGCAWAILGLVQSR